MIGLFEDKVYGLLILSVTVEDYLYIYSESHGEWSIYACMKSYLNTDLKYTTKKDEMDIGKMLVPMEFL